jgi:hypothetical protein
MWMFLFLIQDTQQNDIKESVTDGGDPWEKAYVEEDNTSDGEGELPPNKDLGRTIPMEFISVCSSESIFHIVNREDTSISKSSLLYLNVDYRDFLLKSAKQFSMSLAQASPVVVPPQQSSTLNSSQFHIPFVSYRCFVLTSNIVFELVPCSYQRLLQRLLLMNEKPHTKSAAPSNMSRFGLPFGEGKLNPLNLKDAAVLLKTIDYYERRVRGIDYEEKVNLLERFDQNESLFCYGSVNRKEEIDSKEIIIDSTKILNKKMIKINNNIVSIDNINNVFNVLSSLTSSSWLTNALASSMNTSFDKFLNKQHAYLLHKTHGYLGYYFLSSSSSCLLSAPATVSYHPTSFLMPTSTTSGSSSLSLSSSSYSSSSTAAPLLPSSTLTATPSSQPSKKMTGFPLSHTLRHLILAFYHFFFSNYDVFFALSLLPSFIQSSAFLSLHHVKYSSSANAPLPSFSSLPFPYHFFELASQQFSPSFQFSMVYSSTSTFSSSHAANSSHIPIFTGDDASAIRASLFSHLLAVVLIVYLRIIRSLVLKQRFSELVERCEGVNRNAMLYGICCFRVGLWLIT